MIPMQMKYNINRIDSSLKEYFDNVKIEEKTNGGDFYFEINSNTILKNVNESLNNKKVLSKVIIDKRNLNTDEIKWKYSINPLDESADYIERVSRIEVVGKDIFETISKKRMSNDYFNSLETISDSINESIQIVDDKDILSSVKDILEKFSVNIDEMKVEKKSLVDSDYETYINTLLVENKLPVDTDIKIYHTKNLSFSEKFRLENEFNKLEGLNFSLFKEGLICLNFSF
jgi:hypothetical protein